MAVKQYAEGFYWTARTASPLVIGGRCRWIAYYNGHFWQFMGSDDQHGTDELEGLQVEVLDRITDPA